MRASSLVAMLVLTATLVIGSGSCREPTQVTLVLTTSVPCGELRNGVAITVTSTPERANALLSETSSVTTTTRQCESNGTIGTLVVLPGDEKGAVIVTAGYGEQQTALCAPANNFKDCIVARRAPSSTTSRSRSRSISRPTASTSRAISSRRARKGHACPPTSRATSRAATYSPTATAGPSTTPATAASLPTLVRTPKRAAVP